MKKKTVAVMMTAAMLAMCLAGCGGGSASDSGSANSASNSADSSSTSGSADSSSSGSSSSTSTSSGSETTGKAAEDITVAGVVFQEDQFMKMMQAGYEAAAEEYGVTLMTANTNNDQSKESELINTYVSQGIDGIAISPLNETTSMQMLETAYDAGLEIAVGNTKLSDADFVCGGYTSDNYNLGELTGQKAREFIENELGGSARIALVRFDSQLPDQSSARQQGFLDQLEGLDIEIVAEQDAWLQDDAVQVVGDILTANEASGGVDIVWAANDGGTIGSVMAVRNAGKAGETFVFGTDAAEQQVEMLRADDNVLQCVTGQDPYTIGYNTMEVLIQTIMGERSSDEYGQEVIVEGICLSREDTAGIDEFATQLAERTGN